MAFLAGPRKGTSNNFVDGCPVFHKTVNNDNKQFYIAGKKSIISDSCRFLGDYRDRLSLVEGSDQTASHGGGFSCGNTGPGPRRRGAHASAVKHAGGF